VNMKRFLIFVLAFFLGFLVVLYIASEKADPVLLDEEGRPINSTADDSR